MKRTVVLLVAVLLLCSVVAWLHFYRQKAGQISLLFSGYQLESVAALTGGGQTETNPAMLKTLSENSLQPGRTYVLRKTNKSNDLNFLRYRLPVRLWLAHCRTVSLSKPAGVFVGQPVMHVEFQCDEHRGDITNRRVATPDDLRSEEQLVVTLL